MSTSRSLNGPGLPAEPNGLNGYLAESEATNYKIATPGRLSYRPFLANYRRINLPVYGNDRR
jgi:hypothetical protein